jgi:hypothetical protein
MLTLKNASSKLLLINPSIMKTKISLSLFTILVVSTFIFSCQKESIPINPEEGVMRINFSLSNLKSANTVYSDTVTSSTLAYAVVSVEDSNGKIIKNSEKVELYNMNGNYISKPLSLLKGNYKLTGFLVLDGNNNVVYISPLKGSSKAYLVSNPLPLTFTIQTNIVTKVIPEVVNASGSKPEDFGYATFNFNVAQTFDFMVGTFIYDDTIKNYKLTSSNIAIYTDTIATYSGNLSVNPSSILLNKYDSLGVTNKITLPERFNKYTLVISTPGYKTFSQTFTKEELKLHFKSTDKGPLVIILEKAPITPPTGLVAYYKFNGDVLDYSGNNNNGTYYGRGAFTTGRKGDANGALDLNGSTDYVLTKNSPSLNPTNQISLCAWYYSTSFAGNGANGLIFKVNTFDPLAYQFNLGVTGDLYKSSDWRKFNLYISTDQGPLAMNMYYNDASESSKYKLNSWYFIVGTYAGDSIRLYVNGVLTAQLAIKGSLITANSDLWIGKSAFGRTEYDFLAGKIDEVRIYNRALTQSEILELYHE